MKFGKAFSDSVMIGASGRIHVPRERNSGWWIGKGRALLFATILLLSSFILIWRLFRLTVVDGFVMRGLSDGNRTRELIHHAPRGILVDRTGVAVVANETQFRKLSPCADNPSSMCSSTITQEEGNRLQKDGIPPGTYLEVDYNRVYPFGESLAHLVGYTGELSQKDLADEYYSLRRYQPKDRVGRMGAEAVYEEKLHGRDGRELIEVDADGHAIRTLGRQEPVAGETVMLAVDASMSQVVAQAFPVGRRGAVIVSRPQTGELLAIYSSPSFNPNAFTLGQTTQQYEALMTNPDNPMFFRAIGGAYPPGSTYKLVTSIAALQEGAMDANTTVEADKKEDKKNKEWYDTFLSVFNIPIKPSGP